MQAGFSYVLDVVVLTGYEKVTTIRYSPIDWFLGHTQGFGDGTGAVLCRHGGNFKIPKNKSCNLFII